MDERDPLEDICSECGAHLGYGIPELHLGICESCMEEEEDNGGEAPNAL